MTEEEQLEILKNWWRKLGKPVLTMVLILFAFLGIKQMWENRQHRLLGQASEQYQFLLDQDSKGDPKAVIATASSLEENYPHTIYAQFAKLMRAKYAVIALDYAKASQLLSQVIQDKKISSSFRQIARIRLARIQMMMNQFEAAMQTLSVLEAPEFSAWVAVLQAEIAKKQGLSAEAAAYYQKARLAKQNIFDLDPFLQLKLSLE